MDCNEAILLINPFIKNNLSKKQTKAFVSHVKNCPECYDELEVRYLVEVTGEELSSDRDDLDYNFSHALSDEIGRRMKKIRKEGILTAVCLFLLLLALAGAVYYFFFYLR